MKKSYYGFIKISRFFGVKAGRSVWKESYVKTRYYYDEADCRRDLSHLINSVIPATGAKIIGYSLESFLVGTDETLDSFCVNCNAPTECCPVFRY